MSHKCTKLAVAVCLAMLTGPLTTSAAKPPPAGQIEDPTLAGEVRGTLTEYGPYGAEGWDVYTPGRSFFVRTDSDGTFVLNYVPAGTYTLVISRQAVKVRVLSGANAVVVTSRKLTQLGQVEVFTDADGDGYRSNVDCDDNDASCYPGAPEICDGKDNDCNGLVDDVGPGVGTEYFPDRDKDGWGGLPSIFACSQPEGYVPVPGDCDDGKDEIYPGAPEDCDELDNDCDGVIDEDFVKVAYRDLDLDGFGAGDLVFPCVALPLPPGLSFDNTDCGDSDPTVYPGAIEYCDGKDNDCDGTVDEDCIPHP